MKVETSSSGEAGYELLTTYKGGSNPGLTEKKTSAAGDGSSVIRNLHGVGYKLVSP